MKDSPNPVYEVLLHMRSYFQGFVPVKKYKGNEPLRSELFSADQMENQGKAMAATHAVITGKVPDQLLKRLTYNEKLLVELCHLLAENVKEENRISPAAEWLLDNFYLIREQIVIGKKHLPRGYSQGLPRLANGPSAGMPRVYDIALDIISHSDGRVDLNSLTSYLQAYQTVTSLTLGELWAIPIMLRLALIENLRRVSSRIATDLIDQDLAAYWARMMVEAAEKTPKDLILLIADMARTNPPLTSPFVAEITRALQGKGPALAMTLTWMEQQLSDAGFTSIELIYSENQKQAADQISVRNSIGSLRFLGATDWRDFVESISNVESILREDIGGVYRRMDFSTRDRYRHRVESIASESHLSESEVARLAIGLASQAALGDRRSHVGYFLIGKGGQALRTAAGIRPSAAGKLGQVLDRFRFGFYGGSILLLSLAGAYGATRLVWEGHHSNWLLAGVAITAFLAFSHLAVALVNWATAFFIRPELLPRMDFSRGIPSEFRTLVVVPTLLTSLDSIASMMERLEVRFLSNPEDHLHFALLTDFSDAPLEKMPDDNLLLQAAISGIGELNLKYQKDREDIFFLFHRPRKWNPREKIWMGYERKRGKLADLNSFLRSKDPGRFSRIVGDPSNLSQVKYVITLDADTHLPRESAWKIIAAMAHPLNRPAFHEKKQRVTEGYGILQPRVTVGMSREPRTRFMGMNDKDSGVDPYTRVTSDVYQDLFGEGSFIGKGIYDVDIFEQVLKDKLPENRILSHDLLEGCYVRSGLLSDVQLYEEYPGSYPADVKRRQRWIRGDWQIGAWMLPFTPGGPKGFQKNNLSRLSRWKIFDNLRRSLAPASLLVLLCLGWTRLHYAWFWTLVVTAIIILPMLIHDGWQLLHKSREQNWRQHFFSLGRSVGDNLFKAIFAISCLPDEAYYSLQSILITSWRMNVSNKRLLQWVPSGNLRSAGKKGLPYIYAMMWLGPALALVMGVWLGIEVPQTLFLALPLLILWFLGPALAWWLSRPPAAKRVNLSVAQRIFLQKLARKTWSYFEHFLGQEDNWLPPDNYQESPAVNLAHRTSPTNIGLSLLASMSAYDFGYISSGNLLQRTQNTLQAMEGLARYRGHFFNWYNTQTLQPLTPRYISTVDSGNLAGHLLVLRQGLLALPEAPVVSSRVFEGIGATICLVLDFLGKANQESLKQAKGMLEFLPETTPDSLSETQQVLSRLSQEASLLAGFLKADPLSEAGSWAEQLSVQIAEALEDLGKVIPWLALGPRPVKMTDLRDLDRIPSWSNLSKMATPWLPLVAHYQEMDLDVPDRDWLNSLGAALAQAAGQARERIAQTVELAAQCNGLTDMDYSFLYDKTKHLLAIGYNVEEQKLDPSYYDLLASEARLGHFVAIAQSKLPQESWFALGRSLTQVGGDPVLLSWSGSMFEYLMPLLVMPSYPRTLLEGTDRAVVARQIVYGRQQNVPWGISESGYNMVDASFNYQYRAFGVPGLGLKRGLGDDLVIAPYASMLALMVDPLAACANLQILAGDGFEGKYGFFEAIDYTPSRLSRGQTHAVIRSFMVHHQGMGFLSLAHLLLGQLMPKRFEADPQFQTTLLLLQEHVPKSTIYYSQPQDIGITPTVNPTAEMRIIQTPDTPLPVVQLLSNGKYHVMITAAGGGYSKWKDLAATRWREDSTRDLYGTFCYIRDMETGEFWSNTHQPTLKKAKSYQAVFSQGHAEFRRRDNGLETRTEIVVSPEDDIELRRVSITNRTVTKKILEITSYAEIVMDTRASESSHPVFSNLFVETEILREFPAILCTRRPRSQQETLPWMFHLMTASGAEVEEISFETDRMQFVGRGRTPVSPRVLEEGIPLSGSQGAVLDPIVAIRYRIVLKPAQSVSINMIYGMADSKEICRSLIEKYQDKHLRHRAFELSWTHGQVLRRQINATDADAQLYDQLAGSIVFVNPALRADPGIVKNNRRGQSGLWSYSISGDLPIVLLLIHDAENLDLVRSLVQAHAYWRLKGLEADLVIWNEDQGTYRQDLQDSILGLITAATGATLNQPGGIFIRSASQISGEDRVLFQAVARVIIDDNRGTLAEQINKRLPSRAMPLPLMPTLPYKAEPEPVNDPAGDLQLFNGLGGFSGDGREYRIILTPGHSTPLPWANVIANPRFGSVVSEGGSAYSWAGNAREFRLSPWNNDPVVDSGGEIFYLRDEETGHVWSPTPLPSPANTTYTVRHGFGYTIFEHTTDGLATTMQVYVDIEASIKYTVLKIQNLTSKARRISVTGYVEWVLGEARSRTLLHVVTDPDPASGILLTTNLFNTVFAENTCFFDADGDNRNVTTDRRDFIGRNGTLNQPGALVRAKLSDKTGYAADPCTAIQVPFELYGGQEKEIVFRLGTGKGPGPTAQMALQYRGTAVARKALGQVMDHWKQTLGAVKVETPDIPFNLLANGWLTYQVLSCRLWARSGFYQSGGAFGFRDQLQDVLALLHARPELARSQILLCASRQFEEGDVQHWWHPPTGKGVRTMCSDDYLWLPYVLSRYLLHTGDMEILKEEVPYLSGRQLMEGEESFYDLPAITNRKESVYLHGVAAMRHGLSFGIHGLPLMGSGDWNDGMDKVGIEGKGESVWLGFFLFDVLVRFSQIAAHFGDPEFSTLCKTESEKLKINLDEHGWDGQWYRRAYFDDGQPLGSAANTECRIDSIAQSWSVLSGASDLSRSEKAMASADHFLVRQKLNLVQLLDPPFDKGNLFPGYIKGYLPGVRENGGQYTHAAVWLAMAFAALGNREKAWELFSMINPLNHADTASRMATYMTEPYVIAADVYSAPSHAGRGGWTWYTGSAGWMYQMIIGSILGLTKRENLLQISPCIPADWTGFSIVYRHQTSIYHMDVKRSLPIGQQMTVMVDGENVTDGEIHLKDDGIEHAVRIELPEK